MKTYSEVVLLPTFEERFEYLKLNGVIGDPTFGHARYLNQQFYRTKQWRSIRDKVIIRDSGCDLACLDRPIGGQVYVHHINPLTMDDVVLGTSNLTNMENLICVSFDTHNAITYGDASLLPKKFIERRLYDTCPWKITYL